ncbi:MAG: hypothetical protein H8E28_04600, partial [Anaerolineae bacterium]|nr:hypothetical protein [Anaerolineae bacterium]
AHIDTIIRAAIHDLKNPLSVIIGCADMLISDRENLSNETTARITDEILGSGQKLNGMLDEITTFIEQ